MCNKETIFLRYWPKAFRSLFQHCEQHKFGAKIRFLQIGVWHLSDLFELFVLLDRQAVLLQAQMVEEQLQIHVWSLHATMSITWS